MSHQREPNTIKYEASWIGFFAKNIFNSSSKQEIKVRHIFRNTIYFEVLPTGSMIILSRYPNRAPYIINIPDKGPPFDKFLTTPSIANFSNREHMLTIEANNGRKLKIHIRDTPIYKQEIARVDLRKNYNENIRMALTYIDILSTVLKGDWYREYRIIRKELECSQLHKLPSLLIGRGSGFTPAGDDVLQGIAASLRTVKTLLGQANRWASVENFFDKLKTSISQGKTTWASSNYIKYSIIGYYDEEALAVINSIPKSIDLLTNNLLKLIRRGHNSGLYISLGLMWGVYYMLKQ